jgi:hypothetical protein
MCNLIWIPIITPTKIQIFIKSIVEFGAFNIPAMGTAVTQWLRCCATNGKVAGSIPDGVVGIFH